MCIIKSIPVLVCLPLVGMAQTKAPAKQQLKPANEVLELADQALSQSVEQYKILMKQLPQGERSRTFETGKLSTASPYSWINVFTLGA